MQATRAEKESRAYSPQCQITLAEAGLAPFPFASARRSGSTDDLNSHRIFKTTNQKFLDSLPELGPFTAKQAQALMTTFLDTRVGYGGQDLQRKVELATPTDDPAWFRFAFRTDPVNIQSEPTIC